MYSICLFNRKGGVGKTTITVNLAACLSMYYNKRCLVVDCDPQGNTTSFLDVSGENAEKPGLTDYYNNGASFDEIVQHYHFEKLGRGLKKKYVDVDLIPGGLSMDEANIVRENQLKELITGQEYDYVFFDCPPSMTDTSISALFASDYVLVPAYADSDSLGGFQAMVDAVNEIKTRGHDIEILGIILNAVAMNEALDKYLVSELREGFPEGMLFATTLRRSTVAKQCRYFGEPICIRDEYSSLGKDYKRLTDELVKKIEG